MKKYFFLGSLLIFSFFLIGAGCANTNNTETTVKSSDSTVTSSDSNDIGAVVAVSTSIVINQPNVKVFNVAGKNFVFSITEIKVKTGDKVTINFSSTDGYHDWVVDEFKVATQKVQTGGNTSVTFAANKAGTYEYYCSVGSHRKMGMVGKLIVE